MSLEGSNEVLSRHTMSGLIPKGMVELFAVWVTGKESQE
jgi:hypothetical protein